MIYDNINNWPTYAAGNKRVWKKVFSFIAGFDAAKEQDGRHVIDGDLLYANVQSYNSKALHDAMVEVHHEYIDVQVVVSGQETIFYNPIAGLKKDGKFNKEKDYGLYERNMKTAVPLPMVPGNFAIFFPEEGHMPGVNAAESSEPVRKIVVKIHKSLIK